MLPRVLPLLCLLSLLGCQPAAPRTPQVWAVNLSPPSALWVAQLEACLPPETLLTVDAAAPLRLSWGEPPGLVTPAYAIGSEALVVIGHPQNGLAVLRSEQVRALFSGRVRNWRELGGADLAVQVWTFAAGMDGEGEFARFLGLPITPEARLAWTPQAMLLAVQSTPGAIGWLPQRWLTSGVVVLARPLELPVLLIFSEAPTSAQQAWIACLQAVPTSPSPLP